MAQKKAGEVEAFLSRPDTSFPVVLLYGPDAGLVSERAARIAELAGVDASDPFCAVTLQAEEVEKDVGRLFDEVRTLSLFGGRRFVRVRGAGSGSGKGLAEAVAALGGDPPREATIVIEGGDMKKGAPLRLAAEKARGAMALPCYPDEAKALDAMIDAEMKIAALSISREAREALRERLGADRLASRGEVRKLCLYCHGTGSVAVADIEAIVGDVSIDTVEETIDAAATGEVKKLPELIERLTAAGTQGFLLQQGLLRHFQALQLMRQGIEKGGQSIPRVVESRHPHFRRKAPLEIALGLWSLAEIAGVLARIEAEILASRKESALSSTMVHATLLAVAVDAARLRARR